MWLSDIDQLEFFSLHLPLVQFFRRNFSQWLLFNRTHSAKLLIVYQFLNGWIFSIDGIVFSWFDIKCPGFKVKRIKNEETPRQWVTYPGNYFDYFQRLETADNAGQNAQHATFCATRYQPGWWRSRIEIPVIWSPFTFFV